MTRSSANLDGTAAPVACSLRPLDLVAGDIRDRLTVLLNSSQVIRLAGPIDNADVLCAIQLIEQQVRGLASLADEIRAHAVRASEHDLSASGKP